MDKYSYPALIIRVIVESCEFVWENMSQIGFIDKNVNSEDVAEGIRELET